MEKKKKFKTPPIKCMCKDGMLDCPYLATKKIATYIPNKYFYMCDNHYKQGGREVEKRFEEMRNYIMKEAFKKAYEIKNKKKSGK